ncbi:MAG: hypothetical protein M1822_007220 [Bathelium mastoideum]|nr:MAG: hypothetical protein M1822_007220 [Bathelium mastoideum]
MDLAILAAKFPRNALSSASKRSISHQSTLKSPPEPRLTHLTASGEAHMVDVGQKVSTLRIATAVGMVRFSKDEAVQLIKHNNMKKGDVLAVARVAGIMAAKRTSEIIPLCHPVAISKVTVDVKVGHDSMSQREHSGSTDPGTPDLDSPPLLDEAEANKKTAERTRISETNFEYGYWVSIEASVECVGPTGVEMEALMAVNGAALTVYDMCKAVDKNMEITGVRVVRKEGGRSGNWRDPSWRSITEVRFTGSAK